MASRLRTSIFLLTALICLIFVATPLMQFFAIIFVISLMIFEWGKIAKNYKFYIQFLALTIVIIVVYFLLEKFIEFFLYLTILFWIFISFILFSKNTHKFEFLKFENGLLCSLCLFSFFAGFICIFQHVKFDEISPNLILFFIIINTAIFDTFAYIIGSKYGSLKLIENISPNKSVEGLFGGILGSLIFGFLILYFYSFSFSYIYIFIVGGLFSMIGDLFISMLKRKANIKDTGKILPGHGGVLDRIDSHLSAIPVCSGLLLIIA
jgi:phosphatidate cytidylyltransferase